MTKIVVTGATGCLGMNLCQKLLQTPENEVFALGRNIKRGQQLTNMGAQFICMDIRQPNALQEILSNTAVIYHCAALSSAWGAPQDFYEINVMGTNHIIEAMPKEATLIHVSSPSIYFNFESQYDIPETQALPETSANAYIASKKLAEKSVLKAIERKKIKAVIIRPRGIFGPYDSALFPRIQKLYRHKKIPIIGHGSQLVDITYVDNVVDAMITAHEQIEKISGKIYNITNNEPMPFKSLIELLFKHWQKPVKFKHLPLPLCKPLVAIIESTYRAFNFTSEPKLTRYTLGVMSLGQTLDIKAAQKDLNYSPKVSIEEGIKRFISWREPHD